MIISGHAREEMESSGITEDEVRECIERGELEVKQLVKGEVRYGKKLELKDKVIMVIYCIHKQKERIITVYPIRRKKSWQEP